MLSGRSILEGYFLLLRFRFRFCLVRKRFFSRGSTISLYVSSAIPDSKVSPTTMTWSVGKVCSTSICICPSVSNCSSPASRSAASMVGRRSALTEEIVSGGMG